MDTLRAAVVGCGGAGRNHARSYHSIPGVQLVGVCDIDADRAGRLAAEFETTPYEDLTTMLAAKKPDLVSVCTKEYHHEEPTIESLEFGTHVLCEKIMTYSLASGRRMLEASRRAGKILGMDYNYRHMPAYRWLKDQVGQGTLGSLVLADATTHPYCWHHALDLFRYLFGEVVEVGATLNDDPAKTPYPWHSQEEILYVPSISAVASLRFESGVVASIASSMYFDLREYMIDLQVVGTEERAGVRRIRLDDTRGALEHTGQVTLPDLPHVSLDDSFTLSIAAYVDALRSGRRPPTTGDDGYALLKIENAVVRSAKEGRCVRLC